jgi:hypothetical protein
LLVYVGTYLAVRGQMMNVAVTPEMIIELGQRTHNVYRVDTPAALIQTVAILSAQTTLTAFLSLSGIILMLFAAPPAPWFAVVTPQVSSRLSVAASALLLLAFTGVLLIPAISQVFELIPLPSFVYVVIGLVIVLWMLVQREVWRGQWLERFLDLL